jgi:hypothetical protein
MQRHVQWDTKHAFISIEKFSIFIIEMNQNRIERLPRARASLAEVLISMQKGEFLSISRYVFKVYSKNHRVIMSKPKKHRGNFPAVASDCYFILVVIFWRIL